MNIIAKHPVADLHCDLLCYLSGSPTRTPLDPQVRCSIPHLREGQVKIQTMAVFTETVPGSAKKGYAQLEVFKSLPQKYPQHFIFLRQPGQIEALLNAEEIGIVAAIENASAVCGEEDDLDQALKHLTSIQKKVGKLLYLSLTWNGENRFGGGAFTKVGLKEDGKRFVDYLCRMGIALDLSHASDYLAFDLLEYIDKENLSIPVIASHSNMRTIANYPRNLPDDIAREIIRRKGIIGLNFIRYLLGRDSSASIVKHVEHLISLGGKNNLCFGADFFYIDDVPLLHRKPVEELFFPEFENAGGYPYVLKILRRDLALADDAVTALCYKNFANFFTQSRD